MQGISFDILTIRQWRRWKPLFERSDPLKSQIKSIYESHLFDTNRIIENVL